MSTHEPRLSPQPWPWAGPRVLIEQTDEARADALVTQIRQAGYSVAVCPGPLPDVHCPLTGDEGCAAAQGADVVVSGLGLQSGEARDALAALRRRLPKTPLIVEAPPEDAANWPELVEGCEVVNPPAPERLLESIRSALERGARA